MPPARRGMPGAEVSVSPPAYSLVIIIHGDGDYRYHDTNGKAYRADQQALAGARRVAEQNPQAEVFIFHQQPSRHRLLVFPRRNGTFYHYRNGQQLAQESYWRGRTQARFDPETGLYHRYRPRGLPPPMRLLFYFGHEIPEINGTGYDASGRDRPFTVNDLAEGLKGFTGDSGKIDLIVLSTCYNGTPHTIAALSPYARTIIASPDNLHLSYFDLRPFERLETGVQNRDMTAFAKAYARQAFDRLAENTQTAVTVAVYDVVRVQGYVSSVDSVYQQTLATLQRQNTALFSHRDCAEDPAYVRPGMSDGVDILYRPPRFGRWKNKQNHSGWECWKLPE